MEDVRFYNVALTKAEVTNEMSRLGAKLAELYATAAMNFNGTTTTAESGIHDGATRTLSAWVNPRSNAAAYQAILDAYDERGSGNNRGTGLGVAGGVIEVRLNGVGLWNTGVPVTLNAWQQITVTISGGTARVYVNGVQKATHTYTTGVTAAKNYHIGFYQTDDNSPPTQTGFFNGQLYDVRVYESVVVPTGKFDQPPLAVGDTASVPAGVPSIINVLANDTDPNPIVTLAVSAVTQARPRHGGNLQRRSERHLHTGRRICRGRFVHLHRQRRFQRHFDGHRECDFGDYAVEHRRFAELNVTDERRHTAILNHGLRFSREPVDSSADVFLVDRQWLGHDHPQRRRESDGHFHRGAEHRNRRCAGDYRIAVAPRQR